MTTGDTIKVPFRGYGACSGTVVSKVGFVVTVQLSGAFAGTRVTWNLCSNTVRAV
jgi:hypothetical protein